MGEQPLLAGRYALVSPLGRGGMGEVWEAVDTQVDRRVAVKLLTSGAFSDSRDIRRFTREAAVTAGLAHPGVPALYDAGSHDGRPYLVMELIDGQTLADLLAEQGPLPVTWAAAVAAQVAAVLAVAHQRDILHRDIKPQNIMLTRDGTAKILDFGLAAVNGQPLTSTGATLGTPGYIAPEQLHNLPATPRTDLYALGCLLYEMLAGEPVFSAGSPAALLRMHLDHAPAALRRPDVPAQLQWLLWQLLEKDPARRPASARHAYELLLPFVSPPGPLGDIDPATGTRTGTQLYARLMTRLAEAGPTMRDLPVSPPPWHQALPAAGRGPGWTLRHSLWLLPAILLGGVGACLSFGYIAARHGRRTWLAAALAYLTLTIAALLLLMLSPDLPGDQVDAQQGFGVTLLGAVWLTGIVHTLWVNFRTRLPLLGGTAAGRG